MKRIYSLVLTAFLPFILSSQYVVEEQLPLVVKKTATWCTPCGTWGWDLYGEVKNERDNQSVLVEMHESSSSLLYSPASAQLYFNHETRWGTPVFYVNTLDETEYLSTGGVSPSITKTNMISAIDNFIAQAPVANAGISYSVENNIMSINSKVKFFQDAAGEYYLSVFLAEENVVEHQSGIGTATHKRIVRASAHSNVSGELIVDGSVSAGNEFTNNHEINLESSWDVNNFYVFAVIWKKPDGDGPVVSYEFVNASKQNSPLNTNDIHNENLTVKLHPNPIESGESFNIEVDNTVNSDVEVIIYNQIGNKVKSIYINSHEINNKTIKINQTSGMNRGLYFVQLVSSNEGINKTMKLVVK